MTSSGQGCSVVDQPVGDWKRTGVSVNLWSRITVMFRRRSMRSRVCAATRSCSLSEYRFDVLVLAGDAERMPGLVAGITGVRHLRHGVLPCAWLRPTRACGPFPFADHPSGICRSAPSFDRRACCQGGCASPTWRAQLATADQCRGLLEQCRGSGTDRAVRRGSARAPARATRESRGRSRRRRRSSRPCRPIAPG